MILRVNQFDPADAQQYGGWPGAGAIEFHWPPDATALEITVAEQDEAEEPLPLADRHEHLRRLIPVLASSLLQPGDIAVARLDGPFQRDQIRPALQLILSDPAVCFGLSPLRKFAADPHPVPVSLRLTAPPERLSHLLADPHLGLHRDVRLHLLAVPSALAAPLLDIDTPDDERWSEILPQASFVLSPSYGLGALQILTVHGDPAALLQTVLHTLERFSDADV